jgi:hypothetical protein
VRLSDGRRNDAAVESAAEIRRIELEWRLTVLMRPGLCGQLEDLLGQVTAVLRAAAEPSELDRPTADTHADDRAAVGELIEQVAVLGEPQRVVQRWHGHAEADACPLDLRRQVRAEHERVGKRVVVGEVMLGQEDGVKASAVGLNGLLRASLDDQSVVMRAARLRIDIEKEAHPISGRCCTG